MMGKHATNVVFEAELERRNILITQGFKYEDTHIRACKAENWLLEKLFERMEAVQASYTLYMNIRLYFKTRSQILNNITLFVVSLIAIHQSKFILKMVFNIVLGELSGINHVFCNFIDNSSTLIRQLKKLQKDKKANAQKKAD